MYGLAAFCAELERFHVDFVHAFVADGAVVVRAGNLSLIFLLLLLLDLPFVFVLSFLFLAGRGHGEVDEIEIAVVWRSWGRR